MSSAGQEALSPPQALFKAIDAGDESQVRSLVEAGADLNGELDGCTPLIGAVNRRSLPMTKLLVAIGADINLAVCSCATAAQRQGH